MRAASCIRDESSQHSHEDEGGETANVKTHSQREGLGVDFGRLEW